MKKRALSVLLAAFMVVAMTAGCGSSGDSGSDDGNAAGGGTQAETGGEASQAETSGEASQAETDDSGHTLTAWAWDAAFNIPALQAAADDYKENVDPEFELVIEEQSQSSDIENAITTGGQANDFSALPDIVLFQDHWFKQFQRNYPGAFVDANDAEVNWDDFSAEKLDYSTVDGVHYGFPVDNGTVIFAYRTDLLEEAGHSVDEMTGISWEDFIKVGEDVYSKTGKYLLSMDGDGNDLFYMMLQAEGVSQFKDGVPNFVENETLHKVVEILKEMIDKNVLYLANDWSDYVDQTIQGDMVAGVMNGNWIIPTIKLVEANSGKWEITSCPTINGGEGYASNGGSSLYITGNCDNVDLAKKFLAYTFGGSTVTYDAALTNGGVITTCIPAGQSDVYNQPDAYFNDQPIYAKIVEMGSHVNIVEQSDYHYDARTQLATALINIKNGADIDSEIKAAEDNLKFTMGL